MDAGLCCRRLLLPVFGISFAVIGWQLALMRCLLISRYHHFSFLIISCALLGFGAGGVILSLGRKWFERSCEPFFRWGLLCFALSLPLCFRVGDLLPVQVYFAPNVLASTLAWWCLFWAIHGIPFLLAGILVGLALMATSDKVNRIYASNLAGSALGGLGAILLMDWVPANGLVLPLSTAVLLSGFSLAGSGRESAKGNARRDGDKAAHSLTGTSPVNKLFVASLAIPLLGLAAMWWLGPDRFFPISIDQYKALAHILRLERQSTAREQARAEGVRGRLDLYSSPTFHTLLSLGSTESPPRMSMLLRDGFEIGSVLSITEVSEARFLESTLSALPYHIVRPRRVLILGETGGVYTWLARRSSAEEIVVVQPDRNILDLLQQHGRGLLEDPRVRTVVSEPRAFLDGSPLRFDIIHVPALEGFAAGSGGIGGLREDYLATTEGFGKILHALTPSGVACVTRGIQDPERDNLKIVATWIEVLEANGLPRPTDHLLLARDELSLATLVSATSFDRNAVEAFRRVIRDMSWEADWFPNAKPEDTNRVHVLPGPPDETVSWYHHAMTQLGGPEKERFYRDWICNIRPATDDCPFFYDFFRWSSLGRLHQAFGPLWPTRSEMGFLVLVLAAGLTAAVAALLLPLPLMFLPGGEAVGSGWLKTLVVVYFAALGSGFMFIEMSLIQMFTRFLGEPVLAAALVVAGLLLFAGLGSIIQPTLTERIPLGAAAAAFAVGLIVLLFTGTLPRVFAMGSSLSDPWKAALGLSLVAPLATLMGMPFPWGLFALHRTTPGAIPLAWAVNGFTSVVSASAAVLLAMGFGFATVLGSAAGAYWLAALVSLAFTRVGRAACIIQTSSTNQVS
jgi:hypothetical protein